MKVTKDKSMQNHSILIFFLVFVLLAGLYLLINRPKRPELMQTQIDNLLIENIITVKTSFTFWIDEKITYRSGTRELSDGDWRVIKPLYINSKNNRAVIIVIKRSEIGNGEYKGQYMYWYCGLKYKEQWHFWRPSETMVLPSEYYGGEKGEPLSWEKLEEIGRDEMKNSIRYDRKQKKWVINDDWYRNYMENGSDLKSGDAALSDEEIMALPESYWINRHLPYVEMHRRALEKIKTDRFTEDAHHQAGKYSETEWDKILRRRDPQTREDWKLLQYYHRYEVGADEYVNEALELTFDAEGEGGCKDHHTYEEYIECLTAQYRSQRDPIEWEAKRKEEVEKLEFQKKKWRHLNRRMIKKIEEGL